MWAVTQAGSPCPPLQPLLAPSPQPQLPGGIHTLWCGNARRCQVLRELSGAINPAQKQENIPQLVLCMSVCVFSLQL